MIDRVEGVWPDAIRAGKRVDAGEWFFKAHFFQDPVQPGSLGVQAMLQTLEQWLRTTRSAAAGVPAPLLGREHTWKYRGQLLPHHGAVAITLQVTESGPDYAVADASQQITSRITGASDARSLSCCTSASNVSSSVRVSTSPINWPTADLPAP